MINHSNYYYKGYDIENENSLEKVIMGYDNPYGYNIDSNNRRIIDLDNSCIKTNQDCVKNKRFNSKKD